MKPFLRDSDIIGFVRPSVDAHTLGISYVAQLLEDAGYSTVIADKGIVDALSGLESFNNSTLFLKWLSHHKVSVLGLSYRLDPKQALEVFARTRHHLISQGILGRNKILNRLMFAGLPEACDYVKRDFGDEVVVFRGDETPIETLSLMGVPKSRIPNSVLSGNAYDEIRFSLSQELVQQATHLSVRAENREGYLGYGKFGDSVIRRILNAQSKGQSSLCRAHIGPYNADRKVALSEFKDWLQTLASSRLLDIVSIGTSQLTQERFGEEWGSHENGGGVPINSALEYREIWDGSRPMLVRTYAGTRDVPRLAKVHELSIDIAWHALSFWWFSEIDGRGPNSVQKNLEEHFETLNFIASSGKPFEPNIPHHFSFRGGDDLTYILSAFLAARAAKERGVRYLVLQIMLNTPKQTSSVQDLAKSRALVQLVKGLQDQKFQVFIQPRAGLDYFSPDLQKAKAQLAAVSMMMTDIEPENPLSPDIIHVVSFSEALFLATPDVVIESIQITKKSMEIYRKTRKSYQSSLRESFNEVKERTRQLVSEVKNIATVIENILPNAYTPDGFYRIFKSGFLATPSLWQGREEFANAVKWKTKMIDGGCVIVDESGNPLTPKERIDICLDNYRDLYG